MGKPDEAARFNRGRLSISPEGHFNELAEDLVQCVNSAHQGSTNKSISDSTHKSRHFLRVSSDIIFSQAYSVVTLNQRVFLLVICHFCVYRNSSIGSNS